MASVPPRVRRLPRNPILRPGMDARMGSNIAGPSLIRVPDWVPEPLGRYYLYFADHKGAYIRLAYADVVGGPWAVHAPGSLQLADSRFPTERGEAVEDSEIARLAAAVGSDQGRPHIASPDVHVIEESREIRMYFHGLLENGKQRTRLAVSSDGIHFVAFPEILALPYLRVFPLDGAVYGMAMPGVFYRSADGVSGFEPGPMLFETTMRHAALRRVERTLQVFWTRVGDAPERILYSEVHLDPDWSLWKASEPVDLLRPEEPWEGGGLPVKRSVRGEVSQPVCQLRDPAVFDDGGETYLLYAVAGESGIAIARLEADESAGSA